MEILLLASGFNSLTQRVFAALRDRGHSVAVELALGDAAALRAALARLKPQLVLAPMLKRAIPADVWSSVTCLVVHPGPLGDRGPSSLDRAVLERRDAWGVTVLQAEEAMDAGPVWATVPCALPPRGKSDLYRGEVADAAVEAVLLAVERYASGAHVPLSQDEPEVRATVLSRPLLRQDERRIDWQRDTTAEVLRRLRSADSQPGVLDEIAGEEWFLHGGHEEDRLRGAPGELLAARAGAVCRATVDGAVWIPQLRARRRPGGPPPFTLPATLALAVAARGRPERRLPPLSEAPVELELPPGRRTWSDIRYQEVGEVGLLWCGFPGGALSTHHCRRLLAAYREACRRPTSVLVLGSSRDFFANGIHLNVIEAAPDPAAESWANINAIDDVVEAVLTTTDRLVVAALGGNAAAGGVMLAQAADEVWCRRGVVLNPHYRLMGLYGSEYWTYTLPQRVGPAEADRMMAAALPVGTERGLDLGLVDRVLGCGPEEFADAVIRSAQRLAASPGAGARTARKKADLDRREAEKPLHAYRNDELARMHAIFFDAEHPYHALRSAFVRKEAPAGTPEHLRAYHRSAVSPSP
ncbi:enoyl-CoA hydratase-related protein [Streptacidiphilus jiangxiensis]|uniref:Putative two-component system protein, hydrogenase maturation factor HypX/HoxX n=1 Tax=Streptacidiphilus jiangxiensis TaxID=235985 RepID=A0A1H7NFP7_STRJI|nr:enoyl-CoA hydratase-related protein [Streptacidiphilus jiangxiensis]SEL21727.1 putative two-component system protein, hydrogenase maturation factor HypX/HoxX [Streptacidiphilus jiangxiensis]